MDSAPHLYAALNSVQRRDASEVLKHYLSSAKWNPYGERILDIGCGTGDITKNIILPTVPTTSFVTGVDLSEKMVQFAKSNNSHPRINYSVLDVENCGQPRKLFPSGFTRVFSFYCLHWIPRLGKPLRAIFHLLEPGGEALLVFLARNPVFSAYEKIMKIPEWKQYTQDAMRFVPLTHHAKDPASDVHKLMETEGFKEINCQTEEKCFTFNEPTSLQNLVRSVNPFIQRIPEDKQNKFIYDFTEQLLDSCKPIENINGDKTKHPGEILIPYTLLIAQAKKNGKEGIHMDKDKKGNLL